MKPLRTLGIIAAAGVFAAAAQANSVLQLDINSLTATASGAFNATNFTGSVVLSMDGNTNLADILINGAAQNIAANQLTNITGQIDITADVVTGGFFTVVANGVETYMATIVAGSGTVGTSAGQSGPFTIDGLTFNGMFSGLVGNMFAGVDVTKWVGGGLNGSFLEFKFGPSGAGNSDNDADIDIFVTPGVVVPMPAPVGLAGAGLLGLAAIRRRR